MEEEAVGETREEEEHWWDMRVAGEGAVFSL